MLIYSMSVSVDGFIADREGAFGWGAPSEELGKGDSARGWAGSRRSPVRLSSLDRKDARQDAGA
jgi:hypothetical protein